MGIRQAYRIGATITAILIIWSLNAAASSTEETADKPFEAASPSWDCRDHALVREGKYEMENNVWGKGELTGYSQCIRLRGTQKAPIYEWTWTWPKGSGGVKAYPEVIYGCKPMAKSCTTAALPRKIRSIEILKASFKAIVEASGSYNTAFDVWIGEEKEGLFLARTELMIWLSRHGDIRPAGRLIKRAVTVDGEQYDVWREEGGEKPVVSFVRKTPRLKGEVDVAAFLKHLVYWKMVDPDKSVLSVELGNEIIEGRGKMRLQAYGVRVK